MNFSTAYKQVDLLMRASEKAGLSMNLVSPEAVRYDMKGRSEMQGDKNWILPKEINANRFF
jgi:hypothetical protein